MKKKSHTHQIHHLAGWVFVGLLITLLAMEGWRYNVKPSELTNDIIVNKTLEEASDYFSYKQQELVTRTTNLATTLHSALLKKRPKRYLYNTLKQFRDFWGISLYQNNQPVIWRGYALRNNKNRINRNPDQPNVTFEKENNTTYWACHIRFKVKDSTGTVSYNLNTGYLIEQTSPLPIGKSREFNIFNSKQFEKSYPLHFSIFSAPPDQLIHTHALSNLAGDSVGTVYATPVAFAKAQSTWVENTRLWRSIYGMLCFIFLTFLVFIAADRLSLFSGLVIQLFFLLLGWTIIIYTKLPSYWVLAFTDSSNITWVHTIETLSFIFINSGFTLLVTIAAARKINRLNREISSGWLITLVGISIIVGFINMLVIPTGIDIIYQLANATDIPLMDLTVIPGWTTIALYMAIGMGTLAIGVALVTCNRLLFRLKREYYKLSAFALTASFLISMLFSQLFIPKGVILNWVFYVSLVNFALILVISVAYFRYKAWVKIQSPLRKILITTVVIAIAGIPIIYQISLSNMDEQLWEKTQDYAQKDDPYAANLTEQLLKNLEQEFQNTSAKDLATNKSTVQARFSQIVQQFLSPRWNTYSFDLQLVEPSGNLIASYSTDLNSPDWLRVFNISSLQAVTNIEGITKTNLRPIVQLPKLINQQNYRTFYRGWIPVYGTARSEPIAWILCSIYQERPNFNKPIRAVMASLTYKDWNSSYLMQRFEGKNLISSAQQGFTGYIPKYKILPGNRLRALKKDTLLYFSNQAEQHHYRTLLWKKSNNSTVQVITIPPDYHVTLFTFFRFSFTLLLFGFLLAIIIPLLTGQKIKLLGDNKRFQGRILDSFLLATLIFLTLLIVISHYAISKQNQDIVKQELFDKLENLSKLVEPNASLQKNDRTASFFSLDSLTTPLNVDASFYTGRDLRETTTPQIYQQHLLTSTLPYEIYDKLFIQNQQNAYSTVELAGQPLLIGYRSVLNTQNKPVATIAIPTFLESPKYDQDLLETISYLILFYLLIFGFFIIGAALISKQLTRPLVYIRRGLVKISAGNLNTKIPVTREDEIGNLALAYNNMVDRLKKLQQELAAAEREAAWKEMAQQVAHEIKNPLTPMKLNVQHLERQVKNGDQDPEKLKAQIEKFTGNLIQQIQSLSNIAADFSKFSQPLNKDFTNVDICSILHSVVQLYEHDEKISIRLNKPKEPVYISGIYEELRRVMINMVKNAYEAIPKGGTITLVLYTKDQHAFIEIEDDGEGIAENDRSSIFVPNFSTKSSGTGLGLAICKKIIEAHEGSISFASIEGKGTTFVIKLPLDQ